MVKLDDLQQRNVLGREIVCNGVSHFFKIIRTCKRNIYVDITKVTQVSTSLHLRFAYGHCNIKLKSCSPVRGAVITYLGEKGAFLRVGEKGAILKKVLIVSALRLASMLGMSLRWRNGNFLGYLT